MWRAVRWVTVILFCLLLVIQFVRPARTNPVVDESLSLQSRLPVDPKVAAILDRSCADCHSNKTRWPWYSNVAPVSWFVIGHVNDARRDLNFSEWGNYDRRRQSARLRQMCDLTSSGAMPLSSYTPLHPGSKLTAEDVKAICDWTRQAAPQR
ncbi:MAG TPA: heme-binding domain-containing protein [Pyrinomonadaceae bacterium]|nr:heme-binding domain-containing protein [Pyrinomonadaceae bacterium]